MLTTMPICFLQANTQQKVWVKQLQDQDSSSKMEKYTFQVAKEWAQTLQMYFSSYLVIIALQLVYRVRCSSDQKSISFQDEVQLCIE